MIEEIKEIKEEIGNEKIIIRNIQDGSEHIIEPYAVESCMNPGTFLITPVTILEGSDNYFYEVKENNYVVKKSEVEKGITVIDRQPFVPEKKQYNTSCITCTNCGRCSW